MFQLDSVVTLWISLSLTLATTFSIVIFWRKILRWGILNFLTRFLLLIMCQILLVISVGLSINRTNGFYSSWGDLFGQGVDYSAVAVASTSATKVDLAVLKVAQKSINGQVIIKEIVHGKNSGISNVVYLVLPKSAVTSIENGTAIDMNKTKVVEFFVGYPSQPENWLRSLDLTKALAISEKANPGFSIIGVIPTVNVAGVQDLECMNFPKPGVQTETWLTTDVRTFVNNRLGILPTRWGVIGVSTGGWCAAMLSIKHEDLFYGAVSIAGYYRPALSKNTDPRVKAQLEVKYDFPTLESAMTGKMDMLLIASVGDIYSFAETKKFRALSHSNINYQYIELPSGGHNARVWISQLGPSLAWLKQH